MKKTYDRKFFRQKLLSERKTVTTVSRLLIVLLLGFPFFTRAGTSDVPRVGGFFPGILVRQDTVTRGEKPGNQKQEVYMGEVMDTEGNPLPGVTVLLKGTRMGTSTDMNGEFRFQAAKEGKAVLVFSFIGMKPVEKEMTPGKKVLVRMEEEVKGIEEVVVNGERTEDDWGAESYPKPENAGSVHAGRGKQAVGIGPESYAQD